jgi:anti-repressor protein
MLEMKTDKVKPFRKWLTHEVLPTIRKTGGYVGNDDLFVDTYLSHTDENVKQLFKLNLMTIRQLNKEIDYMKPLAEFAETVADSVDTIDVGQLAKLAHDENILIGRNRLFEWMREHGLLRNNTDLQSNMHYVKLSSGVMICLKERHLKET